MTHNPNLAVVADAEQIIHVSVDKKDGRHDFAFFFSGAIEDPRINEAVVDTLEGPLRLVNCHLGLAETERQWQVRHLLEHSLFCEGDGLPTLIVGDTNDWRNTLAGRVMQTRGMTLLTHPLSRFRSFPAWMPVGALDKAFARGPIDVRHARLVRSALTRQASDHLPLVLDFHVNGQGPETRSS